MVHSFWSEKMRHKGLLVLVLATLAVSLTFSQAPVSASGETTVTGMVESLEGSIVIKSGEIDYVVTGKDLSEMVGKTVKATGVVTDDEGVKTIEVTAVEEVKK